MISTNSLISKRIMLIGSNGMLGQRLTRFLMAKPRTELLCCSAEDNSYIDGIEYRRVDIGRKSEVKKLVNSFYPDVIINTAAYTNVDKCETEKELAWKINVTGIDHLLLYVQSIDAHLIHISTDYVFDGKKGPYTEKHKPNPISYYGRTKLAGENKIVAAKLSSTIIRTNVLYGPASHGRPDFVKWVVSSLREEKQIRIVTDQINNPTFIDDLVDAINKIIEFRKFGTYNIGGKEFLSRHDFTLRIADFFKLDKNLIVPIKTADLRQPAPRPLSSGLITLKAETELGYKPTPIETTFSIMKSELKL